MRAPANGVAGPLSADRSDRRVIVAADLGEQWLALHENGAVVELAVHPPSLPQLLGALFKGIVTDVRPGVRAAFVDAGLDRPVFVAAATDDPEELRVCAGDEVLVQISREPHSGKGWRATSELTISGFTLVLTPGSPRLGVSRRIVDPVERERLLEMLREIAPPEGGLIARTAAHGRTSSELSAERDALVARWRCVEEAARAARAPAVLAPAEHPAVAFLREHFGPGVTEVVCDDAGAPIIEEALAGAPPSVRPAVRRHRGPAPLIESWALERVLDQALSERVALAGGGRLVIQPTEALTAVDVDSAGETAERLEQTALRTNLEAAAEAARQVRLRRLGGLIVIDFIDMERPENRARVSEELARVFARDPLRTRIAPLSEFAVAEITRQRRRAPLSDVLTAPCACCGLGRTLTPQARARGLLREMRRRIRGRSAAHVRISAPVEVLSAARAIYCAEKDWLDAAPSRLNWRVGPPEVTIL